MKTPLPSNDELEAYSSAISWLDIENQKRRFNRRLKELAETTSDDALPLDDLSEATGIPISTFHSSTESGNSIIGHVNGKQYLLASFVSKRYRKDKPLLQSITPYNFNPSVNHTNLDETENPKPKLRAIGAELELGLYHEDGSPPTEEQMQEFIQGYRHHAHRLGITPQVDREACMYQVEVHIAPGIGYHRMRQSLDHIMESLVAAGKNTQLNTAIMSSYPILSDFALTPDPKVQTAVDVMQEVNSDFPEYMAGLNTAHQRYNMNPASNFVETFRLQGCHVHLDIAGRSEALGLFTFYTMLHSATAIASKAVLKGGPFVNGTCDAELTCTREYLRSTTVTGRYLEIPVTPHFTDDGLANYTGLLASDRANAAARALLYDDTMTPPVSVMHNPIGRVRPDLGSSKRICTIESTGLPVNISASRQAAVLTDLEFTHVLVESYFRKYGTNLEPLYNDPALLAIIGPLDQAAYQSLQDASDRHGSDIVVKTAAGTEMALHEFYELKRNYMHQFLIDISDVSPREIDDVYMSLQRMLNPPSGRVAETPEQYIHDSARRSTGNWGAILRDAFIEEGGTLGEHNPDAVLRVANRVHKALEARYS